MERKFKIMGVYVGLLFFVSILLIMITSLSNDKINPVYMAEEFEKEETVDFSVTLQESVSDLTAKNEKLMSTVEEQNKKIENLEKFVEDYQNSYNEDTVIFMESLKLYAKDKFNEARDLLKTVNAENLTEENRNVFENMIEKLK